MNPSYSLEVTHAGDACVASLTGEIDLANVPELERRLTDAAGSAKTLVIVLAGVDYIDSTGFGLLERLSSSVPLRLVLPSMSLVHTAFRVTGLAQIVAVFESVEEALKAS